jgi:hypothetical protein
MPRIIEADRIARVIGARHDLDWETVRRGEDLYYQKWEAAMRALGFTMAELDALVGATDFYTGCRDDGWDLGRELPRFWRIADDPGAIRGFLDEHFPDPARGSGDRDALETLMGVLDAAGGGFARRIRGEGSILIYDGREED